MLPTMHLAIREIFRNKFNVYLVQIFHNQGYFNIYIDQNIERLVYFQETFCKSVSDGSCVHIKRVKTQYLSEEICVADHAAVQLSSYN